MPRATRRAGAIVLPLLLLVVAACSAGPSSRPPVAYRDAQQQVPPAQRTPEPAPVPPLGPSAEDSLDWEDCTAATHAELNGPPMPAGTTFSCAKLLTTLDSPEEPTQGTSRSSLLAAGRGTIPLIVVNDAGGEPGTTFAARLSLLLPRQVLDTFRIIGIDRRGSGESDPADCVPQDQRGAIVGFDPRAADRTTLDGLLDSIRQSSQECLLDLDDRLLAFDTWRAAGDLEELRIELGVPKLHAIGRGEGSRLLTTYSERYPKSVGRMVLDGGPDPLRDAMGWHESQARGAEGVFDSFAADCVNRGNCPLGPDPRRTVSNLVERTRSVPLPAGSGTLTAGQLVRSVLSGLGDPQNWPHLVQGLDAANRGDGSPLASLSAPLVWGNSSGPPWLDADLITSCNDTTLRVPPQRSTDTAADWVKRFPLFGGIFAQRLVWCGQWPVPQRPLPVPKNPTLPPIPVVATAHDPLMPELGSRHLADQLATGVVLNWQGTGHGAIGRSSCVTDAVARYLTSGVVPTNEMACPA